MSFVNEPKRIAFVETRDGVAAARDFCRQLLIMYSEALQRKGNYGRPNFARQPIYRKQYVESMLVARAYLRRTR